jgi:hypothetical protein
MNHQAGGEKFKKDSEALARMATKLNFKVE